MIVVYDTSHVMLVFKYYLYILRANLMRGTVKYLSMWCTIFPLYKQAHPHLRRQTSCLEFEQIILNHSISALVNAKLWIPIFRLYLQWYWTSNININSIYDILVRCLGAIWSISSYLVFHWTKYPDRLSFIDGYPDRLSLPSFVAVAACLSVVARISVQYIRSTSLQSYGVWSLLWWSRIEFSRVGPIHPIRFSAVIHSW